MQKHYLDLSLCRFKILKDYKFTLTYVEFDIKKITRLKSLNYLNIFFNANSSQ